MRVIVVARKPVEGTVAENVVKHGCGAINVDACRVGPGRWPSNVILQGNDVVEDLGNQSGILTSGKLEPHHQRHAPRLGHGGVYGNDKGTSASGGGTFGGDTGTAARFFKQIDVDSKMSGDVEADPQVPGQSDL
jgi:site-specific DNA-methyltransferase (adenine-specific)